MLSLTRLKIGSIARWGFIVGIAALVALGSGQDAGKDVYAAGATAQFSLATYTPGGPVKNACDSIAVDRKCIVHPGSAFEVQIFLDKIAPGMPDGGDAGAVGGYRAITVRLDHSAGLTMNPPSIDWGWPDCAEEYVDSSVGGIVNITCFTLPVGTGSVFASGLTPAVTMDFTCPSVKSRESITMVFGTDGDKVGPTLPYDTYLLGETNLKYTQSGPSETLIINCDNVFPWDINGDTSVSALDIFQTIGHFNETKPTP